MLIDSTILMYATFQGCRHGRTTDKHLNLLSEILKLVEHQLTFSVDVPDHWLDIVYEYTRQQMTIGPGNQPRREFLLSSNNQQLFSLLCDGVHELQRLWSSESKYAVRSLGYAFHIVPQLLRTPEQFDRDRYMFCFRAVCAHWEELSPEMQKSFCNVLGIKEEEAQKLIKTVGFPIKLWGDPRPDMD